MKKKSLRNRKVFAFRQWSRRPYAVFNSLKLLVKISVLSVAYTIVNPVQECKAQTDSTEVARKIDLDEVEVSGQRAPVVYSQIARVISVITRDECEQAPVQSVNELLENVPQVDIRQRGTNGVQADISIQGGSFDQTLILLNGINLTDPQTGHHNLNLPIDIESIDRVEILKGPASRVFGTNAFSGAVNFVTGENPNPYIKAGISGGEYGLYRGFVSFNQHSKTAHNFISISKTASDGYISNTDYNILNAFYHGKLFIRKNTIGLQLGTSQKEFGANGFYSPKYPEQFESTRTYFGSLGAEIPSLIKLSPKIYWRRNYDHYILIRSNPAVYQNFHYTDVYGASINAYFNSAAGKTDFGAEFRKEIIYSTVLGKTLDSTDFVKVPDEEGKYYTKKDWRNNFSIFVEHNLAIGKISASAGVMANLNTKFDGMEFYPGIDLGYQVTPASKLYFTVNRSLRLPSFTDLYYAGPQNVGNPDLVPEEAWTFETGIKLNYPGVDAHLSLFQRNGTNIIDWIWQDSIQKWHTENITKLRTDGVEVAVHFSQQFLKEFAPFIKSISLGYSYTNIDKSSGDKKSNYALDNLKHKFSFELTHAIYKSLGATWRVSFQDRNGGYLKWDTETQTAATTETPYKPFTVADVKIYYTTKVVNVFAECNNLFDTYYFDFGNLPQPGFWFRAGINVSIGLTK